MSAVGIRGGTRTVLGNIQILDTFADRPATFPTTGATEIQFRMPFRGVLREVHITPISALAAHDSNYLTFALRNYGAAGAGNTAMLAATDANTTKATGGTALAARTPFEATLHGTTSQRVFNKGDVLSFTATATGTLASAVTTPTVQLTVERL